MLQQKIKPFGLDHHHLGCCLYKLRDAIPSSAVFYSVSVNLTRRGAVFIVKANLFNLIIYHILFKSKLTIGKVHCNQTLKYNVSCY